MSASLVGSEMCIRDRGGALGEHLEVDVLIRGVALGLTDGHEGDSQHNGCLLYTSDAADDM
eukprot:144996-Alexandrium_andersonii.AAC.1